MPMIEFVHAVARIVIELDEQGKKSSKEYRLKEKQRRDRMTKEERLDEDIRTFIKNYNYRF